ncbi:cobyrinate a,c-diamide synthase [Leptolyngbya sp. FACHB-261]|uniref:cobyrinate a,c-diamide synthase n=1 Tax=Leptolyngbya sp. FACHB-261 TaxID=2692806 RepID=UPI00168462AF|nr:cobyrinate a,c-diamide synthase [Leptolyngbya sp. FACHB-261]MBD2103566.1 cobyrinate a,c-diamide synthase [Leptolyngbya sp. FACHB-261]
MALIIAGTHSGVGKTTVTLALLAALVRRGLCVQSFKVGPDYIDPMFHTQITGRPCRNLDPVLTSEAYVTRCFASQAQGVDAVLVEGVMGLFDGDSQGRASTAHLAHLLQLPVLLVVDCARMAQSVAAMVHGYCSFDPQLQFAGVVLNRVGSERHRQLLEAALEPLGLPILGVLYRHEQIQLPSRHLGLVPTEELPALLQLTDQLAHLAETHFDWAQLMPLLQAAPLASQTREPAGVLPKIWQKGGPIIAVARDPAFSFYYADNLELLAELGAEVQFWSPLQDRELPVGTQGLYFGGGFPEMFASVLAENQAALAQVRQAIQAAMPVYAECGGLMYLSQSITTFEGDTYKLVGALPTQTCMGARLTLGYRLATTAQDSVLGQAGQPIQGHEFHRSTQNPDATQPLYQFADGRQEGWQLGKLTASYVHLHWGATPELPAHFLRVCQRFAKLC